MTSDPPVQSPIHSLLSWSYWAKNKDISVPHDVVQSQHQDSGSSTFKSSLKESSSTSVGPVDLSHSATSRKISGWERLRSLYEQPSMERDYSQRIIRMTFLSGFFLGGFSTLAQARETFERCNVGRGYLSHTDAFKRRADYAIVRFAKSGFVMGFKCALISGSIVCVSYVHYLLKIF